MDCLTTLPLIVSVIGKLSAGALAALPAPEVGFAEPALREPQGPAGSWVATVTIAGAGAPPPFQALRTYADGGGYIETSSNSKNPQAPDSSGHGAWVSTGATDAGADGTGAEARTFARGRRRSGPACTEPRWLSISADERRERLSATQRRSAPSHRAMALALIAWIRRAERSSCSLA